jgi:hypothetical protein
MFKDQSTKDIKQDRRRKTAEEKLLSAENRKLKRQTPESKAKEKAKADARMSKKAEAEEEKSSSSSSSSSSSMKDLGINNSMKDYHFKDSNSSDGGVSTDYINPENMETRSNHNIPFAKLSSDLITSGVNQHEINETKSIRDQSELLSNIPVDNSDIANKSGILSIIKKNQSDETELKNDNRIIPVISPVITSADIASSILNDIIENVTNAGIKMTSDTMKKISNMGMESAAGLLTKMVGIGGVSDNLNSVMDQANDLFELTESKVSDVIASKIGNMIPNDSFNGINEATDALSSVGSRAGSYLESIQMLIPAINSSNPSAEMLESVYKLVIDFTKAGGTHSDLPKTIQTLIEGTGIPRGIADEISDASKIVKKTMLAYNDYNDDEYNLSEDESPAVSSSSSSSPAVSSSSSSSPAVSSSSSSSPAVSSSSSSSPAVSSSSSSTPPVESEDDRIMRLINQINPISRERAMRPDQENKTNLIRMPGSNENRSNTQLVRNGINNYISDLNIFGNPEESYNDSFNGINEI